MAAINIARADRNPFVLAPLWAVACTIATIVGLPLSLLVAAIAIGVVALVTDFRTAAYFANPVMFVTPGVVIGAAQGWFLTRAFNRPPRWMAHWLLWTAAAYLAGGLLASLTEDGRPAGPLDYHREATLVGTAVVVALAATVGIVQARLLSEFVRRAGWWVPTSVIGFLIPWATYRHFNDFIQRSREVHPLGGATEIVVYGGFIPEASRFALIFGAIAAGWLVVGVTLASLAYLNGPTHSGLERITPSD